MRWCGEDPVLRIEFADRLFGYVTNLDFKPAPDAGQFVHYEQPDYANREMATFFNRLVR